MKTREIETIYEALAKRSCLRTTAIKEWCAKHNVNAYLAGGVLVLNIQLFIQAVVSNTMPDTLKQELRL